MQAVWERIDLKLERHGITEGAGSVIAKGRAYLRTHSIAAIMQGL
jgi:hypothetical protein